MVRPPEEREARRRLGEESLRDPRSRGAREEVQEASASQDECVWLIQQSRPDKQNGRHPRLP